MPLGGRYAERGAVGSLGVDFAVAGDGAGLWEPFALEVNLRNGGTTHPITVLRNSVPGRYDVETGRRETSDGTPRCYRATDNMVDIAWLGLSPAAVITAVAEAGVAV